MQVTLNESPIQVDSERLTNLEEALLAVNENHIPEGEQLFQVKVNGKVYSESYPRESRYIDLESIAQLDINTVTDEELTRAILEQSGAQVQALTTALEKGANLFRVADEKEANSFFALVLDSLHWLLKIGEISGQILNLDLNRLYQMNGETVSDFLSHLGKLLDEMIQTHEDQDFVLLADLMEYELLPLVEKWKKVMATMAIN